MIMGGAAGGAPVGQLGSAGRDRCSRMMCCAAPVPRCTWWV